jgi:subtilisin-like proprotein convertase family protein
MSAQHRSTPRWSRYFALVGAALLPALARGSAPPPPPGCPVSGGTFVDPTVIPIPAGPAVISSTILVAGMDPYLWDVDVSALIRHINNADLDITLRSPAGTVITLSTDNGGTFDDVFNGTLWDDDANPGGPVPYVNNNGLTTDQLYVNLVPASPLVPEENLAIFLGENPNGPWTLTISDDLALNGGQLDGWRLDIAALAGPPTIVNNAVFTNPTVIPIPTTAPPIVITSSILVAGLTPEFICDVNVITTIQHTFGGDIDMTLTSPGGTIVTLTTDNGGANDNTFNGTRWDDSANPGGQVPYVNNNGLVSDHLYANLVTATPLAPEEAMGAFIGENPNGLWTLTISDDANADGGQLTDWTLDITVCACTGIPTYRDYLYTGQPTDIQFGPPSPLYPPIPPDFFDPGSEPFQGLVCLEGDPIATAFGNTDTVVRRLGNPVGLLDPPGSNGSVPIEIVALSLVSCQPITVTYSNGNLPQQWNIAVDLSNQSPPPGNLFAQKTHPNGGVFNSSFFVQPRLTFVQVGNPLNVRVLDTGGIFAPLHFQINNAPWVHNPTLDVIADPGSVFFPAIEDVPPQHRQLVTATDFPTAWHTFCPAFPTPGACCYPDGSCRIVFEPECLSSGGLWQGAGSNCGEIIYPPPATWPPSFTDISGSGTLLDYGTDIDDGEVSVAIPFPYYFYGNPQSSMLVSTNGYVTFGAAGSIFLNDAPPSVATPNDAIYALWDDLHLRTEGAVHAQVLGAQPDRVLIVQWTNVDLFSPSQPDGARNTFQIKLFESSNVIEAHYLSLVAPPSRTATIGVENSAGTVATTFPDLLLANGNTLLVWSPSGMLCPQPTGACCVSVPQGQCVVLTRAECQQVCGRYFGDGTNCADVECEPPTGCPLPGCDSDGVDADFDNDCDVDLTDLSILLGNFGGTGGNAQGDTDGNNVIDLSDLANLLGRFGNNCN